MQISISLGDVLTPSSRQKRGLIQNISKETSLERHYVSDLLKGKAKKIRVDALERLCQHLIDEKLVAHPERLPGSLFVRTPATFVNELGDKDCLHVCMGVRPRKRSENDYFLASADASLQGAILHELSTNARPDTSVGLKRAMRQHLVTSPGPMASQKPINDANDVYLEFDKVEESKALVAIGSLKANSVSELVIASTFSTPPFESREDDRVPIFFRYGDEDVMPPSCCGGTKDPMNRNEPGIYFKTSDGAWDCCVVERDKVDCALAMYVVKRNRVEVVLGGFTTRATRHIAATFDDISKSIWPPSYDDDKLKIGMFIVELKYSAAEGTGTDRDRARYRKEIVDIHSLSVEAIESCLK